MRWTLDDIDWAAFQPSLAAPDLVQVVKTAALVEANAPDYVSYLQSVFQGDDDFCAAAEQWGQEERQHGQALARWAQLADPEFDFDRAMRDFAAGFRVELDVEHSIRGSRPGELIARCVVESGTSTFYKAILDSTDEPVLRQIATKIAADEVHHYRMFRDYLLAYEAQHGVLPKRERLRVIFGRVTEVEDDEFGYAWYAANVMQSGAANDDRPAYDRDAHASAYNASALGLYRFGHMQQAIRMMLKVAGLDGGKPLGRAIVRLGWWAFCLKLARIKRAAQAA